LDTQPLLEAKLKQAITLREQGNYDNAVATLKKLNKQSPNNFCILYELGRAKINTKDYASALVSLQKAAQVADTNDHKKQAIYNIIGYTYLQTEDVEKASAYFEKQKKTTEFQFLPNETKMKIYNNSGLTLLRLSQYEESRQSFTHAKNLGSKLAIGNLAVVDSLLEVQKAGDKNIPGIYGVALLSSRDQKKVARDLKKAHKQLGVNKQDLTIYKRKTGIITGTLGSNISYAKAQDYLKLAKTNGYPKANIVATSSWQEISFK
jgi:tetratricopeptide (TPR) repeat protein